MDVGLDFIGDVVVDDTSDGFDIEASSGDICSDQGRNLSISKAFENFEAAFLVMIPVKGSCGKASAPKVSIELNDSTSCVAENDTSFIRVLIQDLVDPVLFGPVLTADVLLVNFWDGGHLADCGDGFRIFHESASERFDLGRKSR